MTYHDGFTGMKIPTIRSPSDDPSLHEISKADTFSPP